MTTQTFAEIVLDYADTDKTTRTLSENFEGFSQILKEQSGEKRYLGVFTNPIAIISKYKTSVSKAKCACPLVVD